MANGCFRKQGYQVRQPLSTNEGKKVLQAALLKFSSFVAKPVDRTHDKTENKEYQGEKRHNDKTQTHTSFSQQSLLVLYFIFRNYI
ncbi:hypothetical protein [Psychrobacillus sp. NPDC093200]|uniref:hypothetical protein n=1 Tax=Psychrobacillus sp. NPDC093200 TaxID=3390656 RepID=UPI003CFCEB52